MWFVDYITQKCYDASGLFYSIYLKVYDWVYPFWLAATYFYSLSTLFNTLGNYFSYFSQWVGTTASKLLEILSYSNIYSYFKTYFDYATNAWSWVLNAWTNVTGIVNSWWASTSITVQSWIAAAQSFLQTQLNTVNTWLTTLQAAWNEWKAKIPSFDALWLWFTNWWNSVLTQIIAWGALTALQIQSLIDTALKTYAPFWEGWQDWKDSVIEFIQDPWQWLYDRVEDLFDRFW